MLIRKDDLEAAVDHGVIAAADAKALTEFVVKRNQTPRASNEQFRVVNNFAEVFICIGLIIVFSASTSLVGLIGMKWIAAPLVLFWLLGEFFTFRTTKTAPAILSVLFTAYLIVEAVFRYTGQTNADGLWTFKSIEPTILSAVAVAALLITFARFRLPILLLPLAACATALVLFLLGPDASNAAFLWPIGLCGLVILSIAVWFDARDPLRRSKTTAYAFWLFVIGSPLTIHPVMVLTMVNGADIGLGVVLAIVFLLALFATAAGLILDRRSLVASCLIYFTIVAGYVNHELTGEVAKTLAVTSLFVGAFALFLGVFWYRARNGLLRLLPFPELKAKLPPAR